MLIFFRELCPFKGVRSNIVGEKVSALQNNDSFQNSKSGRLYDKI